MHSQTQITPTDQEFMLQFTSKTSDKTLSEGGNELKRRLKSLLDYYRSVNVNAVASKPGATSSYVPGIDKFLDGFVENYVKKKEFRESLVVSLAKGYVAKVEGHSNPPYGAKVLNFLLALAASGDTKSFQFVSGNLCSVSLRQIQRITAKARSSPFIDLSQDDVMSRLTEQFRKIRAARRDSTSRVSFTAGIDGTVLVKSYQILHSHGVVVGGAFPNHYLLYSDVATGDELGEAMRKFLLECVEGKHGELAAEIKVCIISFQNIPPGMCPYFVLTGHPQTLNELNDFGQRVLEACDAAAKKDGKAALLNVSTDGVSCEVQSNLLLTIRYLNSEINYVALADTNHNVKNARYQMIGGSSPAVFGCFVFDPWLLKLAKISQKLWRVEDYASDAIVLRLASAETVQKLVLLEGSETSNVDPGNLAVVAVSLVFMRLRSYAVNARNVDWKERAVYSWSTFLWFSSFHTPGSTMITNKRNMLLETVAFLFLVTREDVSQTRRTTSECNEHYYGLWRMIQREFNMEQLIRIFQKIIIKLQAIF